MSKYCWEDLSYLNTIKLQCVMVSVYVSVCIHICACVCVFVFVCVYMCIVTKTCDKIGKIYIMLRYLHL